MLDLADGSTIDIVCAITVDPDAGEILVDYAGSSPARARTASTSSRTTPTPTRRSRCASVLNPELPNNHGSLAPIKVEAPEGSIVNAVSPQPCTARHVVGMFLPNALLKALAQIKPRAGDGRGLGRGVDDAGQRQPRRRPPVHHGDVHLRRWRRRPRHQAGPVGVLVPDRRRRRAHRGRRGVGADPLPAQGAARRAAAATASQIGGLGQTIEFTVDTDAAVAAQRRHVPPARSRREGIFGGEAGRGRVVHGQRRAGHARRPA